MNGKQFLKEIKKDEALRNIPVIIYSTSSDADDKQEVKQLGAVEFVTKPPYLKDLTAILNRFFATFR